MTVPLIAYFLFFIYHDQAIDLIESIIYKPLPPKPKKKPHENVRSISFEKNVGEFLNIARILRGPKIVKSLPTSSAKCPIAMVIYRLNPTSSPKSISLWKF